MIFLIGSIISEITPYKHWNSSTKEQKHKHKLKTDHFFQKNRNALTIRQTYLSPVRPPPPILLAKLVLQPLPLTSWAVETNGMTYRNCVLLPLRHDNRIGRPPTPREIGFLNTFYRHTCEVRAVMTCQAASVGGCRFCCSGFYFEPG